MASRSRRAHAFERSEAPPDRVEVRIGRAADLRRLRRIVTDLTMLHGAPAEVREDVVLAVQEAAKNGLVWGGAEAPVVVELCCDDHRITVEVCDLGPGFDLAAVEEQPLDPAAEHSRGILLMRDMMDSVRVRCGDCCTIVMTRRF